MAWASRSSIWYQVIIQYLQLAIAVTSSTIVWSSTIVCHQLCGRNIKSSSIPSKTIKYIQVCITIAQHYIDTYHQYNQVQSSSMVGASHTMKYIKYLQLYSTCIEVAESTISIIKYLHCCMVAASHTIKYHEVPPSLSSSCIAVASNAIVIKCHQLAWLKYLSSFNLHCNTTSTINHVPQSCM